MGSDFWDRVMHFIYVLAVILCGIALVIQYGYYEPYAIRKANIEFSDITIETLKDSSEYEEEYAEELEQYITKEDMNSRLYDKVIVDDKSSSFIYWLKNGKVNMHIIGVKENTETLKIDNTVVTSKVIADKTIYNVNGIEFIAPMGSNMIVNVPTEIEIQYPRDQKESGIITDYTVVYQNEN